MAELNDIRETVRERYVGAAKAAAAGAYDRSAGIRVGLLRRTLVLVQPGGRDGCLRRPPI